MAEKRKFEERKQKHTKLKQLWEERGMVKFEQKFDTISDTVATKIKNKIKKLENDYKIAYEGSIPRVSNGTYHMKNVNATDEARLLLLSSGNNSLAEAIKEHLRIRYDAALVDGAKRNRQMVHYSPSCHKLTMFLRGTKLVTSVNNWPILLLKTAYIYPKL